MKLTKIKIQNFKSIQEIEFEINKHGNSYTTMLLGVNESGKSNILEAMSFFDTPENDFIYDDYYNQKDETKQPVDLWFSLEFDNKTTCVNALKGQFEDGDLLSFHITNITKNVYLLKNSENFMEDYSFDVDNLSKGLFIKKVTPSPSNKKIEYHLSKTEDDEFYEELTNDKFNELFKEKIIENISIHEPRVTFWEPSSEYLISKDEDLNAFASNINSKPALKNIFMLAGYKDKSSVADVIGKVSEGKQRTILKNKLQVSLDKYIKKVWKHDIDVVIEITESGKFTLLIKDSGEENEFQFHSITGRSAGAQHFLSLILSLSIENEHEQLKNQLILIDEPELHLHPSGIRDLREELLKIGKNNYVFVSTHSPFLVDKKNKERNIIVKKNRSALTHKLHIEHHTDIIDDEVLREAFGLEVYKDLLNPHSILVEGASDKMIIQKVLNLKGKQGFGITNGHGSNIDTVAAKLNDTYISPLVVLDDDKDGKTYKSKIIRSGGSYTDNNVVTIRDLVGKVVEGGTLEDLLGKGYVQSTFKESYKNFYIEVDCDIEFVETEPFVKQMKAYLQKKVKNDIESFIELVKNKLADDFSPAKGKVVTNFPLLDNLVDEIIAKLN
jgi:predicted ATP-dependent endonuclease of OLD family